MIDIQKEKDNPIVTSYKKYLGGKRTLLVLEFFLLLMLIIGSLSFGAVHVPVSQTIRVLFSLDGSSSRYAAIIREIRLPQTLSAVVAGAGLAAAGAIMQVILQNPLGSPFTLGISHAAAFGAACSVMLFGTGVMQSSGNNAIIILAPYKTTIAAMVFALGASFFILVLARVKQSSPEVMILAGVAIGSLCSAGTMFLQYFADDVQLAAMVFWTFGDVGRVNWHELEIITVVTMVSLGYFFFHSWYYNAMHMGDETAKGLGVPVERVRLIGMGVSALVTSVIIAFVGVIGFIGLVAPHISRRLIGDDHRYFLMGSLLTGSVLLLASDVVARLILAPRVLPVAILTAFLGAPVFIVLLMRGHRR